MTCRLQVVITLKGRAKIQYLRSWPYIYIYIYIYICSTSLFKIGYLEDEKCYFFISHLSPVHFHSYIFFSSLLLNMYDPYVGPTYTSNNEFEKKNGWKIGCTPLGQTS
jgi:hypothetical protein